MRRVLPIILFLIFVSSAFAQQVSASNQLTYKNTACVPIVQWSTDCTSRYTGIPVQDLNFQTIILEWLIPFGIIFLILLVSLKWSPLKDKIDEQAGIVNAIIALIVLATMITYPWVGKVSVFLFSKGIGILGILLIWLLGALALRGVSETIAIQRKAVLAMGRNSIGRVKIPFTNIKIGKLSFKQQLNEHAKHVLQLSQNVQTILQESSIWLSNNQTQPKSVRDAVESRRGIIASCEQKVITSSKELVQAALNGKIDSNASGIRQSSGTALLQATKELENFNVRIRGGIANINAVPQGYHIAIQNNLKFLKDIELDLYTKSTKAIVLQTTSNTNTNPTP